VKPGFTASAREFQSQPSESENPFYCMSCLQMHYNNEISQLKEQLTLLSSKITSLTGDISTQSQTVQISENSPVSNTSTQSSSVTYQSHSHAPSHLHQEVSNEKEV